MSDDTSIPTEFARRCPHCDSVVTDAATRCSICGEKLDGKSALPLAPVVKFVPVDEAGAIDESVVEEVVAAATAPTPQAPPPDSPKSWRPTAVFILTAVFIIFMLIIGSLILRYQEPVQDLGLFPTLTPIPSTIDRVLTAVYPPSLPVH